MSRTFLPALKFCLLLSLSVPCVLPIVTIHKCLDPIAHYREWEYRRTSNIVTSIIIDYLSIDYLVIVLSKCIHSYEYEPTLRGFLPVLKCNVF